MLGTVSDTLASRFTTPDGVGEAMVAGRTAGAEPSEDVFASLLGTLAAARPGLPSSLADVSAEASLPSASGWLAVADSEGAFTSAKVAVGLSDGDLDERAHAAAMERDDEDPSAVAAGSIPFFVFTMPAPEIRDVPMRLAEASTPPSDGDRTEPPSDGDRADGGLGLRRESLLFESAPEVPIRQSEVLPAGDSTRGAAPDRRVSAPVDDALVSTVHPDLPVTVPDPSVPDVASQTAWPPRTASPAEETFRGAPDAAPDQQAQRLPGRAAPPGARLRPTEVGTPGGDVSMPLAREGLADSAKPAAGQGPIIGGHPRVEARPSGPQETLSRPDHGSRRPEGFNQEQGLDGRGGLANLAEVAALSPGASSEGGSKDAFEWSRQTEPLKLVTRRLEPAVPVSAFGLTTPDSSTVSAVAPPAESAVPSQADRGEAVLGDQIVQAMRMQWRGGLGEARVTLRPEYLGALTIALRMEGGGLTAHLQVEDADVRAWVQAHEDLLRSALAGHGLTLERFVVSDEPARHGRREQGDPNGRNPTHRQSRRPASPDDGPVFQITA